VNQTKTPEVPKDQLKTTDDTKCHNDSHADHAHAGHFHHHGGLHSHHGNAPKLIWRAIFITLIFMFIELVGGWLSNSLALVSDAAHMLTDIGAMLLSLFAIWFARRPTTLTMSFGYHRAEILGALFSVMLIWMVSGVLIFEALVRLQSPPEVQGPIVLVVATIGLGANLLSMKMLHGAKADNINIRAAYLHLLSDSLGSIGAILAGLILWLTNWHPIDPLITILFAILMLVSSWGLLKETLAVLMESTPTHVDPKQVTIDLHALVGVEESHDLHIWSVSSGKLALSVHLISRETEILLERAHTVLRDKYGITHTTIQIEHPDRFQSERCYDCVPLEIKPTK
jgi:cobalt-zinc-cadmium efflux system protein